MTRSSREISIEQAVAMQLANKHHRRKQEQSELIIKLNRSVSTPPDTERDLALKRHIAKREREGSIHKSEWGD